MIVTKQIEIVHHPREFTGSKTFLKQRNGGLEVHLFLLKDSSNHTMKSLLRPPLFGHQQRHFRVDLALDLFVWRRYLFSVIVIDVPDSLFLPPETIL